MRLPPVDCGQRGLLRLLNVSVRTRWSGSLGGKVRDVRVSFLFHHLPRITGPLLPCSLGPSRARPQSCGFSDPHPGMAKLPGVVP